MGRVPFSAGDRVTVRGERWIIQEATAYEDVTLLSLTSAGDAAAGRRCRLLTPFDRPVAAPHRPKIRVVARRAWMHHLHAQLAELHTFGQLRAPQRASIDILPFQLEPALALVRGCASRFLLADEVGLGKTIQAGLMLAELQARGWCERALIVTPAGLRQQWAEELHRRFAIQAAIIDAASLAALAERLPFDVNPWSVEPVAITSIDFLKQAEVLHAARSLLWDALIVDEAHHMTVASLRYDAVNRVAQRARHVVLLTATPHGGNDRDYQALCAIGAVAASDDNQIDPDPILLFRRTREQTGVPRSRRAHLLCVRQTPQTAELYRLLDDYVARLWSVSRDSGACDLQLVAMILAKRAFSSAASLAISLERRLAALSGEIASPVQPALPFGAEDDVSDEAPMPGAPGFAHVDEERRAVERLIEAANCARGSEGKMLALGRLVRRIREPLIVFTEYRDTLDAIRDAIGGLRTVAVLHGGQTPYERKDSLNAFTTGGADTLLATDAGSEGLNLQGACRIVINLELPWSPIRLEQRIGRVDRIGQTRTVHAINLLAEGTAERTVLANLLRRIDRIRLSEIDIAASVISRSEPPLRAAPADPCTRTIDLGAAARFETARIAEGRRRATHHRQLSPDVIPVVVRESSDSALVAFFRVRLVTHAGRVLEDGLLPVRIAVSAPPHRLNRREARAFAEAWVAAVGSELRAHARAHGEVRARTVALESAELLTQGLRRERAVGTSAAARGSDPIQGGLFDNRALKQKWAADERSAAVRHESDTRAALLDASARVAVASDPELVMLLISCSRA